jgi:hypothetical protein
MAEFRSLGFAAISWIEHFLVHGPGDVQGQPIDLDDEFAAFVLKAYAVDDRGARRVRRAFLSRSKGRSKSGFAAMIECFEALGPCRFDHWAEAGEVSDWGYEYDEGEPVGAPLSYVEILNVATEEGQAGNTYDAVHYMLHPDTCSPALKLRYGRLDVGLTRINLPDKRGFIEPVTASNESKDGGKSTFIVADETHLWIPPAAGKFKLGKMHQTMVRNLLKRKLASGWMLETSTMYAEGEQSVAEGTHAYAKSLAKAGRPDGKLLFDHRQASDRWDLDKRGERIKALKEAYGPAAAWMDLQAIADYWDDPQASHAEFRRFWLNQPVPLQEKVEDPGVFGLGRWESCAGEPLEMPEQPTALGVAVSVDRTWASIAACSPVEVLEDPSDPEAEPVDRMFVAAVDRREGTAWLVERLRDIQAKSDCVVIIDEKGPTKDLRADLEDGDVAVEWVNLDEYAEGCSRFFDKVHAGTLLHPSSSELDDAVRGAAWRAVGDRQVWGRRKSGEVSMLEAATLAVHGAEKFGW